MSERETAAEFAVIGGSGFYDMPELSDVERIEVDTPWGTPSSAIAVGTLAGRRVAFLARHAEGHRLLPSELPSRANIYALKLLGVERVIAVSAVGSLTESMEPLHAVVPDQLIDHTRGRESTFFGDGAVAHIGFADPFCPELSAALGDAASAAAAVTHRGGALVVTEGPAFSTRAESQRFRSWGAMIIGMTALPEAKLAREAELCYASLCFVTDYDVWHEREADVTAELVLGKMRQNVAAGRRAVASLVERFGETRCACRQSLATALVTAPELVPAATRRRLGVLVRAYWGESE